MRAVLSVIIVLSGLGAPAPAAAHPAVVARPGFSVPREVAANIRPYNGGMLMPRRPVGVVDGTGVRMYRHPVITRNQLRNHPVAQAQYGLKLLNTYRVGHDAWFLTMAERQAQRLVDTHVESRNAWWFPYPFDFPLGSNMRLTLNQPWYSAMAQGQALSLFIRLAQATGDSSWRVAADRTFESLRLGFSAAGPWATHRDGNNQLWLEEYPARTPTQSGRVLNGHMFAMYGLWDYWFVTRSSNAAALFDAAGATVRRYVLRNFRNTGWASSYALRGLAPAEGYHNTHVDQLLHMHALSGDPTFSAMAEVLQQDFSVPAQRAPVLLVAAQHTGVRFAGTTSGQVTGRKLIALRASAFVSIDQRRRIGNQPGYWYHVTSGSLRGFWVQEVAGVRATIAPVSLVHYLAPRAVRMEAGAHQVCTASGCSLARLTARSSAPIGSIGWIRGRRAVLISGGPLRNWWLPMTARTRTA